MSLVIVTFNELMEAAAQSVALALPPSALVSDVVRLQPLQNDACSVMLQS